MPTVPQNDIVCGMQETPLALLRNAMYFYSMAVYNLIDICISITKHSIKQKYTIVTCFLLQL